MAYQASIPSGLSIVAGRQATRVPRKPKHTFHIKHEPYAIQPFMIAPVLPGETLKNLLMQSRAVTDPIKNSLIGWWLDHYFFYVKLRDLATDPTGGFSSGVSKATIEDMLLDQSAGLTMANGLDEYYQGAAATATALGYPWLTECVNRIVKSYFRSESEGNLDHKIGNLQAASILDTGAWDSVILDADMPTDTIDGTTVPIDVVDAEGKWETWQYMRQMGLTDMSFEDYLATFGVRTKPEETGDPELVRFVRNWQYPSNTVNPSDGSVASAVSWAVTERADKDRFFKEPGFLIGVTVARPKLYFSKQQHYAAGMLTNALDWLPAVMKDNPFTSLKKFDASTGPLADQYDAAYWVDVRDLFVYGDQFVNFDLTSTENGLVALPDKTHALPSAAKYPSATDVRALFSTVGTDYYVKQDGVVSLNILGTQLDHT